MRPPDDPYTTATHIMSRIQGYHNQTLQLFRRVSLKKCATRSRAAPHHIVAKFRDPHPTTPHPARRLGKIACWRVDKSPRRQVATPPTPTFLRGEYSAQPPTNWPRETDPLRRRPGYSCHPHQQTLNVCVMDTQIDAGVPHRTRPAVKNEPAFQIDGVRDVLTRIDERHRQNTLYVFIFDIDPTRHLFEFRPVFPRGFLQIPPRDPARQDSRCDTGHHHQGLGVAQAEAHRKRRHPAVRVPAHLLNEPHNRLIHYGVSGGTVYTAVPTRPSSACHTNASAARCWPT